SCNTSADVSKVKDFEVVKNFLQKANVEFSEAKDLGSIYEVVVARGKAKNIVYVTKDGKYILLGELIDKNINNVTRERANEINKVDFKTIPFGDAIEIKKGSGAKKLVMITDLNCPYCKKAYEWLKTKDNYTLYVFFMPLSQPSQEKSVKVLCSKDILTALSDAKAGKDITAEKCDAGETRVKKHAEFAQSLGVSGTPLFIIDSGKRIEGFNQPAIEDYLGK
ncbi:MAG: DsbC family protein, partial [Thermodesulfovibrionales bacterium]|nr:DsbC family protein [Thermodesulfovibrionales bacterium]